MASNLEEKIAKAGNAHTMLWESQDPPIVSTPVTPEFTNWRDEQMAWRSNAVLFDQSHHMADLNIKGPDALKLIRDTAINSVEKFPINSAKQYIAANADGQLIGDNILFQRADSVEAGWRAVQPFLDAWKNAGGKGLKVYEPGSEGPEEANDLMERDGRSWRKLG